MKTAKVAPFPCGCAGTHTKIIEREASQAVKTALHSCGKMIPWQVMTLSADGTILD